MPIYVRDTCDTVLQMNKFDFFLHTILFVALQTIILQHHIHYTQIFHHNNNREEDRRDYDSRTIFHYPQEDVFSFYPLFSSDRSRFYTLFTHNSVLGRRPYFTELGRHLPISVVDNFILPHKLASILFLTLLFQ